MEGEKEENLAKLIINFSANTRKTAKQKQTRGYLIARKRLLDDYWAKFIAAHEEALQLAIAAKDTASKTQLDDSRFAEIEGAYCEALGELEDALHNQLPSPSGTAESVSTKTTTKVPKIELPKFDGTFATWLSFKDMFSTCVINDVTLSDVQQLHYLKGCLSGDAEVLLRNLLVIDSNFKVAWDILQQRFDNKRRLLRAYLHNIVKLPSASAECSTAIRKLMDGVIESERALTQLGRPTEKFDDWLVYLITEKLDTETLKQWELSLDSANHIPTYKELVQFLEKRIVGLEAASNQKTKDNGPKPVRHQSIRCHQANYLPCPCCAGKHILMFCSEFKAQSPTDRLQTVMAKGLCKNCLKSDHMQNRCPSSFSCKRCNSKHHTMLHDSVQPRTVDSVASNHVRATTPITYTLTQKRSRSSTLLATAQVSVVSPSGRAFTLRALLGSGSQATFISEFAAQQLRLPRLRIRVPVTGVGGAQVGKSTGTVDFIMRSLVNSKFSLTCSALTLPSLGHLLPTTRVKYNVLRDFADLELADPQYNNPGSIDLILGADVYSVLLIPEIKQLPGGSAIAQRTHLGWVIFGKVPDQIIPLERTTFCAATSVELNELVKLMWQFNKQDDLSTSAPMSQDEAECESFFESTVKRTSCGRYIVKYPLKDGVDLNKLKNSKEDASRLFNYQQKRLEKDSTLKQLYESFMDEYLRLEHMEPVSEHCDPQQFCYIPHHGVYKESSSTTKLRIVFNASYRNKSGVSLNDCLHVGPKLQNDLASVILKWRTYRIGFMADIEKCYRQILVDPEDTDLQRIVWLNEMGDPTVYRLRTVTYGLNCSPYLTIKVLHSLAKDEGDSFPQAAQVLKHSFYMDDCLHGADDSQSAIRLQKELQLLLERGGFTLRKWNSNSIDFLHSIEGEQIDDEHRCNFDQHQEVKALGLYWIASSDEFIYKVNMTELSGPITKRQQLADVAKIYDPPGWVAPIVITGKIICQQLWVTGCNWDDVIPEPYQTQWRNFRNEIREVEAIKVPRWVHTAPNAISYQLHVFADASAVAYAAITYLRVIAADESVKVSILTAKTKVAPLKKITIPCLELNGALLAAKLAHKVQDSLNHLSMQTFFWSDSTTALAGFVQIREYISNTSQTE